MLLQQQTRPGGRGGVVIFVRGVVIFVREAVPPAQEKVGAGASSADQVLDHFLGNFWPGADG